VGASLAAAALVLLAIGDGAAEPREAAAAPAGAQRMHVVARGDTLSGLAARYRVTVTALVAANRLSGQRAVLRVGQRLVVPAAATVAAAPPTAASATRSAPAARASSAARAAPAGRAAPEVARVTPAGRGAPEVARATPDTARPPRPPAIVRGPRGLMLAVPDFVDAAPAFLWPVEGPVSSTFGRRRSGWHRGIDITAERGGPVFASAPGVVVVSAVEPRYGRVVKIEHDDGFLTVYAHNEENLVHLGTRVAAGDVIATIGRTGRATAYHLHFEIRRDGAVYNPLYLLPLPPRVGHVDETNAPEEEHE
jgi:murein DD-endopeptidase MepM/ murein hydrolase activator NlpD